MFRRTNRKEIKFVVIFVYPGMSGLLHGPYNSPGGRIWGRLYQHTALCWEQIQCNEEFVAASFHRSSCFQSNKGSSKGVFFFFLLLHLLNLKSLQLKIIFITTLSFLVGPHSCNEYRQLKLYLRTVVLEKYNCGHASVFHGKQQFCLINSSSQRFWVSLLFCRLFGVLQNSLHSPTWLTPKRLLLFFWVLTNAIYCIGN